MVVSRFAPSPTGDLHIGGVRTALYAWLFARQQNGKFILRIENTDVERSTAESTQGILAGMKWIGLDFTDGPIYQLDRLQRYTEVANDLLDNGDAYKCYCSKERLEELRNKQMASNQKPKYDGFCRFHATNTKDFAHLPHVIRFANPMEGEVHYDDRIRGELKVCNSELDDLVIIRTDGIPTYNFAVVVDDVDMEITMVIRGDDHINNTFRQINIFHALGAKPPQFAHVPSILGGDGKKLSKRHGAASVLAYRDMGILPEALVNALVRLGWSHGDQEIFSEKEMLNLFKITNVHKSPAVFDVKKLLWFNQHYLKTLPVEQIIQHLSYFLDKLNVDYKASNKPDINKIVEILQTRCKTLEEMANKVACFYLDKVEYNQEAVSKFFDQGTSNILTNVIEKCKSTTWDATSLHTTIDELLAALNLKMPQLAQPIRIALTGNTDSPPLHETMALMPKNEVLERLQNAVDFLSAK